MTQKTNKDQLSICLTLKNASARSLPSNLLPVEAKMDYLDQNFILLCPSKGKP